MLNIGPEMIDQLTPAMIIVTPELIERFSLHIQEFNETYTLLQSNLDNLHNFIETKLNIIYVEQHKHIDIDESLSESSLKFVVNKDYQLK
jgi:hypothetical protein